MDDELEQLKYQLEQVELVLNETRTELTRVFELYERFCKSPFYWFVRPLDAKIDKRELMQCSCGGYFWKDRDAEFSTHSGHTYQRAINTSVWTYIKARYKPNWIQ